MNRSRIKTLKGKTKNAEKNSVKIFKEIIIKNTF